jgi:hypothetical protein
MDENRTDADGTESQDGITRREALRRTLAAGAGLWLADRMGAPALASSPAPVAVAPARAKSVIQIWMWGGPCHLDTFDPKPDAGYDYCGPLAKPIATNVSGIRVGELLPMLAQQADKYSIIRSMTHGVNAHETASYMVQTGHDAEERIVYPCAGSVVSLFKGPDHGYTGLVPPYVVLTESQGRFSEEGFLGQRYKPFVTGGDPAKERFAVEGVITEGVSEQRQQSRRDLLARLDTLGSAVRGAPVFAAFDASGESAARLAEETAKVFDLTQEQAATRDAYGRNTFGQSCLMARRLAEMGVPYITINYKGWDTHKQHFETMRRKLPEMDRGLAALLQDLAQRGLLDSTIVWWGGEFGRTPKVQWEAPWNGGRGHFGACFSAVVAGGGFKGGHVVGASDAKGMEVADRAVTPQEFLASMYTLMGIDPAGEMPNPRGVSVKVMPVDPAPGGGLLREIM